MQSHQDIYLFLSTSFNSVSVNGWESLQMTHKRWIFAAATSTWTHPPITSVSFYHLLPVRPFFRWFRFRLILCCLLLRLKHCLVPQHRWTKHFWLTAEQWIGLTLDFFLCRQWGRAAVVLYCSLTRCVLQCRSETKTKSQEVDAFCPGTFLPLCV